jgi:sarcosine oxidase subunit gamma
VADEPPIVPTAYLRRSFIYRTLQRLGAEFVMINGAAVALRCGVAVEGELAAGRRLGLADLSPLPRTGFKGAGTLEFLTEQGLAIGDDSNVAYPQSGGGLAARLAPSEIFFLDGLDGEGKTVAQIKSAWHWGEERPRRPIGYPMPRDESHCWFTLTGEQAPAMLAKLCGVDLRPAKFAAGRIAQTSVAKINAIVIRCPAAEVPAYHLLADSASAEYFWTCLTDAMAEFDGKPIGLAAVRQLLGNSALSRTAGEGGEQQRAG